MGDGGVGRLEGEKALLCLLLSLSFRRDHRRLVILEQGTPSGSWVRVTIYDETHKGASTSQA